MSVVTTLRKLWLAGVAHGLPIPVLAALALLDTPWPGYSLVLVSLGYLATRHRGDGLGKQRLTRGLLVVGVMIGVVRWDAAPDPPLLLAGVLLIGLISYEPMLHKALDTGRLRTANLEVVRRPAERILRSRAWYLGHTALAGLYCATAWLGLLAWPVLTLVTMMCLAAVTVILRAWGRRRSTPDHQHDPAVWQALCQHAPRYVVHFSAPPNTEYHVGMWLPYLERLGLPYLVILREAHHLSSMVGLTKAPIVVAPAMAQLEHTLPPSVSACFYVNNGMKNVHMVRLRGLCHVQLLHGDSDKASSFNPATGMFDKVFVSGQAGIDRYRNNHVLIPNEKFAIVGRPQVYEVRVCRTPITDVASPTVLYAPTWTGWFRTANYCSLPIAEVIVRGLLDRGVTVVFRPHPYSGRIPASARHMARVQRLLAEDTAATGRRHLWGNVTTRQMSLFDCMNTADAMVSDVSAVASDWLFSEKPLAITDMLGEGGRFALAFPLAEAAYVIEHSGGNLETVLDTMLGADPLAATRRRLKTYYLGDFAEERYADAFVTEARSCIETGVSLTGGRAA